ncbi:hypothetical protein NL108_010674, partial [Boleophthalmus pectinirostris]
AEDQVDTLSKELIFTQHKLQTTQEQMGSKEEEAAMLKEVFRRELEKADQSIERSSGIIADYKQICSQLTERLERQQAAHRHEIDSIKTPGGHEEGDMSSPTTGTRPQAPGDSSRDGTEKESFRNQIRELEQELARTKLQMVEAKCKIQ